MLVIEKLREVAREQGAVPVVYTFCNHPLTEIAPERAPKRLMDPATEVRLLQEACVEVEMLTFDARLRSMTAAQWLRALHDKHGVRTLVMGYDNTFGCDGVHYSLADYKRIAGECGVELVVADCLEGISSSVIRRYVAAGEMRKAAEALGRDYALTGVVSHGQALGRTIGFPTANVEVPAERLVPATGVYAARAVTSEGEEAAAVVNVGTHPTVGALAVPAVEAHLLDWQGDLYGKKLTLSFVERLREEKQFADIAALKNQIHTDVSRTRELLCNL